MYEWGTWQVQQFRFTGADETQFSNFEIETSYEAQPDEPLEPGDPLRVGAFGMQRQAAQDYWQKQGGADGSEAEAGRHQLL